MMHLLLLLLQAAAQPPALTVDEIMARVAENQDRAREARTEWVFHQDVLARLHRGNGKLAREESWEYVVTPQPKGVKKDLLHFAGQYEQKGKMISYDHPHYEYKGIDIDGDVISSMGEDFAKDAGDEDEDKKGTDLFPLTRQHQKRYQFTLEAHEDYRGIDSYRVTFRPKPRQPGSGKRDSTIDSDAEDGDWKGEVVIDAKEFQPIVVTTGLAWGIPMADRALLGTDVKHVGFKITYKKVADGVWFPESYGGEFFVKALFMYKRTISVGVKNSEFHKTDVQSKVAFETPQ